MHMKNSALVVVDMIYDFIDGSLACLWADKAVANTVQYIGEEHAFPILFVRDHHPANHCSFVEQGGPWPPHCVQGTRGAEVHKDLLRFVEEELCFYKGENPALEQYSGFEGKNEAGQTLGEVLSLLEVENVVLCGIATEYCVRNTAEDLLKAGFKVTVLKDCLACVEDKGHYEALDAMKAEGIRLA